ncbi:hypothetical protein FRC07_007075 [Ceratobasidium sp. 392]|nr:hypothetical protein FRC07_007075 [Ceratobasidium sp. 392]
MLGIDFFADSSLEDNELRRDEDRSKRRKLDLEANESGSSKGKGREVSIREQSSFSRVVKADKNAPRTSRNGGTPAFMSARVLNMKVGEQYEHHFMDDLESFFWLILWCVAEHTDARGKKANPAAYKVLNRLSQRDLDSVVDKKVMLLAQCYADDGDDMRNMLKEFDNNWANDPAIVSVILALGSYFYGAFMSKKTLSKRSVDTVFPMVLNVIRDALES